MKSILWRLCTFLEHLNIWEEPLRYERTSFYPHFAIYVPNIYYCLQSSVFRMPYVHTYNLSTVFTLCGRFDYFSQCHAFFSEAYTTTLFALWLPGSSQRQYLFFHPMSGLACDMLKPGGYKWIKCMPKSVWML